MRSIRASAATAILALGLCTAAEPIAPVRVTVQLSRAPKPTRGFITFRPAMGPAAPIVLVCCGGTMTVDLPPKTVWEVLPHLEGAWAARRVVVVAERASTISLQVFLVAKVIGRFQKGDASPFPPHFAIAMYDLPARPSGVRSGEEVECPIGSDGRWSCELPNGIRDLLMRIGGFVPLQKWGVSLATDETRDLGTLQLRRGASVSGWVQLSEGKLSEGAGKAAVVPLTAGATGATGSRVSRPIADAALEKNGYFQIVGVPAGQFAVQVTYPGFASETIAPLQVLGDRETRLTRPIVLHRPVSVRITLQPPLDSRGKPWTVIVMRASPFSGSFETAPIHDAASRDGAVKIGNQSPGRYHVDVYDSAENRWSSEEFQVTGEADASHTISIEAIGVRGTLEMDDKPVAATLWFGGKFGAQRVAMRSAADGKFQGTLPHGGKWRVTIDTADNKDTFESRVEISPSKGEVEVAITLPSNELTGIVVDDRGEPTPKARVTLAGANGSSLSVVGSEQDGTFRFRGMQSGDVLVAATFDSGDIHASSDAATVHVDEKGSFGPVQLVLIPGQRLTGTVRSTNGPIAGAHVAAFATGTDAIDGGSAATDADGHFIVRIPGNAQRAMLTVRAPGHPLRVFDVPLPNHAVVLNVPEVGGELDLTFGRKRPEPGNQIILVFQDDRLILPNELFLWASSHGVRYPEDQAFELPDMAPAHYTVCVIRPRAVGTREITSNIAGGNCADGFLAPFGKLSIDLPATP